MPLLMRSMLHIHNGDSTADTLRAAGYPGRHFAFREALAWGPAPEGLAHDEWVAARAAYLGGAAGADQVAVRNDWAEIEAALSGSSFHEETILWFEHDLHCQINLTYLLARFARRSPRPPLLSLICIGEFPGIGIFHGLGELSGDQLASLFETRHPVTEAESNLAEAAWRAYTSADPRRIERLLAQDTSALPFLGAALQHHLERYPSTSNGLGAVENLALRFIAEGYTTFGALFRTFANADPIYGGLGDLVFLDTLKLMADPEAPLISIRGDGHEAEFAITDVGAEVLARKRDYLATHRIDQWLGGVHLTRETLWRWDEATQALRAGPDHTLA